MDFILESDIGLLSMRFRYNYWVSSKIQLIPFLYYGLVLIELMSLMDVTIVKHFRIFEFFNFFLKSRQ